MKIGRISYHGTDSYAVFMGNDTYLISDYLYKNNLSIFDLNNKTLLDNISEFHLVNESYNLLIPLKDVNQVRDFYTFEEHVRNSRKNRGLEMNPLWYQIPIYYYTNKDALRPSGEKIAKPSFTSELDLEIEIGIIIGKDGRNIEKNRALEYIYGLTLMNDWSARDLWRKEAALNLGPSKSKDFATSIGPYITTTDELAKKWNGKTFDIDVGSSVNGVPFSRSNMKDMYFSIGQMIEYCSMDSRLKKGDILMTGTMAGGCLFERNDPETRWLQAGDIVEIRSETLGILKNEVS